MGKHIMMMMIVSALILAASVVFAQQAQRADSPKGHLRVIVDGFQNNKGTAKIGLCNSGACFKNSEELAMINTTVKIVGGKALHVFDGVPYGTYAVTVYHDENGNGKLDKGSLGKPLELYGFSNKARGLFSRPEYEKAAFVLDRADMTVNVTVQ